MTSSSGLASPSQMLEPPASLLGRRAASGLAGLRDVPSYRPVGENGECYEEDQYGNMRAAPVDRAEKTRCCSLFGTPDSHENCMARLEKLRNPPPGTCGQVWEALYHDLLHNCCLSSAYDEALAMGNNPPACERPADDGSVPGGGGDVVGGDINCNEEGACVGDGSGDDNWLNNLIKSLPLILGLLGALFGKRPGTGSGGERLDIDPSQYTESEKMQALALYGALGLGGIILLFSLLGGDDDRSGAPVIIQN